MFWGVSEGEGKGKAAAPSGIPETCVIWIF